MKRGYYIKYDYRIFPTLRALRLYVFNREAELPYYSGCEVWSVHDDRFVGYICFDKSGKIVLSRLL